MKKFDFEKLEFVDSFVVFLDVLGFKNLVFDDKEDELQKINFYFWIVEKYLQELQDELDKINQDSLKLGAGEDTLFKLDYILISDSIIITVKQIKYDLNEEIPEEMKNDKKLQELYSVLQKEYNRLNKQGFEKLCEAITNIQKTLASQNVWLRGAITAGTTHISTNKKQIVGKAYINAFKLEAKEKYPRVILDKQSIFNALHIKDEDEFMKEIPYIFNWNYKSFKKSFPLFLDYVFYDTVVSSSENRNALDQIINNVLISYEESKLTNYHDKYVWLLEYMINCLERGDESYSDLLDKLNNID